MLEADEQDSLELQPPRAGTHRAPTPPVVCHRPLILLFGSFPIHVSGRIKPVPAPTSSALMRSDSDLDSDDGHTGVPWTEQERGHLLRPQNGSLRNGQGPVRGKKHREELL